MSKRPFPQLMCCTRPSPPPSPAELIKFTPEREEVVRSFFCSLSLSLSRKRHIICIPQSVGSVFALKGFWKRQKLRIRNNVYALATILPKNRHLAAFLGVLPSNTFMHLVLKPRGQTRL